MQNTDQEFESLKQVNNALSLISEDKEAVKRILMWAKEKFLKNTTSDDLFEDTTKDKSSRPQFERLAQIDSAGNFMFTVRDLKAKNQTDAVKRLSYLIIYLHNQLLGDETTSRKKTINPFLEKWRLNDGNARHFLANDPGILKNGDNLKLDIHATEEAEKFISEITDSEIAGSWKPGKRSTKRKLAKATVEQI